jgi:hypothetical protein
MRSWKMSFIIVWKVAGELVRPRLEEPPVCTEHSLPFVTFPDPDVVKTPLDIEFCEELGSLQTVNKIVD